MRRRNISMPAADMLESAAADLCCRVPVVARPVSSLQFLKLCRHNPTTPRRTVGTQWAGELEILGWVPETYKHGVLKPLKRLDQTPHPGANMDIRTPSNPLAVAVAHQCNDRWWIDKVVDKRHKYFPHLDVRVFFEEKKIDCCRCGTGYHPHLCINVPETAASKAQNFQNL